MNRPLSKPVSLRPRRPETLALLLPLADVMYNASTHNVKNSLADSVLIAVMTGGMPAFPINAQTH